VCVPDIIGVLAVWIQNQGKKKSPHKPPWAHWTAGIGQLCLYPRTHPPSHLSLAHPTTPPQPPCPHTTHTRNPFPTFHAPSRGWEQSPPTPWSQNLLPPQPMQVFRIHWYSHMLMSPRSLHLPLCLNCGVDTVLRSGRQFFFLLKAATQLARQVQQERTQVVCSNKVGRSRLAQRHSRNGPRTYEY
jgi:hypothetical protein